MPPKRATIWFTIAWTSREFADVAQHEHCLLASLVDVIHDGLATPLVHLDNRNLGALCCEQLRHGLADISSRAGYNGDLSLQLHASRSFRSFICWRRVSDRSPICQLT